MASRILLALAAASVTSAHFVLHWPPTAGFDEDGEPTGPCGGVPVTVNSSSPQIQVDQFAIQVQNTHPVGEWQIRATTDTQEPYNFTDIVPIVNTTGIGDFCLPTISAPAEFAGRAGIIQVIDASVDGTLYQCAPVNFVTGSNSTLGSACTNATGFSAVWTDMLSFNASDSASSSAPASGTASSAVSSAASESASETASGASGAASGATETASSSAGAALATGVSSLVGGLALLAAGLAV